MKAERSVALVTATVAWAALALQLGLIIARMTGEGATVLQAIWRFFGFFTILTNLAVAITATAMALQPESSWAHARVRLAMATAIIIVGIVYSLALRALWSPAGWQAVADHALHDATPPLFLISWLMSGHGLLTWRDVMWALAGPLAYCVYALVRGAADGWYAYWFLDAGTLSVSQLAINILVLLAAFLAVSLVLIFIDKRLAGVKSAAGV
jgi:hypothetical protein